MINRNEALTIIEADILLADERKDCIDAVVKRLNQIYDELESRSCNDCKFGKFGVDSLGIEVECLLNWKCSRAYGDNWESKR